MMTSSPSVVIWPPYSSYSRAFTSAGRPALALTFQRSTALLETLLTFWPPGPPDRAKLQWSSSSGIWMWELTWIIGHLPERAQRQKHIAPPDGLPETSGSQK